MLVVRARAATSNIHGIGLIAQERIKKGTRVWVFRSGFDLVFSDADVASLSQAAKEQVRWYAYWDPSCSAYVLSGDDDRFTNHADDPNTTNDGNKITFAVRDIEAGEEITWDYRGWGGIDWDHQQSGLPERRGIESSRSMVKVTAKP